MVAIINPVAAAPAATVDALIAEFGGISGILAADPARLRRTCSPTPHIADYLVLLGHLFVETRRSRLDGRPILSSTSEMVEYLRHTMASLDREQVRVFFLNGGNVLIRDEIVSEGSASSASVFPREVMRRALELGSTALILAHNHPSGNPKPSGADVQITRAIIEAGRALDIVVHDHLIIGRSGWTSMRVAGLL